MRCKTIRTLIRGLFLVVTAAVLTACGGGGGTSASSGGTGSVGVLLTDAPTTSFDHVYVTITGITLLGGGAQKPVLFQGTRTVDLMALSSVSDLFTVQDNIPAGDYSKIRLDVSGVELKNAGQLAVTATLPSRHVDLNPRGPFTIEAGRTLIVELDMDAEKSIHIVATGSGKYIFRPVVFVRTLAGVPGGRLTRIHGVAADNGSNGAFDLCRVSVVAADDGNDGDDAIDDSRGCVHVITTAAGTPSDTGVFGTDGSPVTIDKVMANQELTAIGFIQATSNSAGGSSATLAGSTSEKGEHDLFDDDYELQAAVLELGPTAAFQRVSGTTGSTVRTNDTFSLKWDTSQTLTTDPSVTVPNPIAVQIQPGTHIFTRDGKLLTGADIKPDGRAVVDSVLNSTNDALKAALVVLGTPPQTGIPGTLGVVDAANDSFRMNVSPDYAGSGPAPDTNLQVTVNGSTRIVLIDGSDDSLVTLADLSGRAGASVTVYGEYDTSTATVMADTVVVTVGSGG